MEKYEAGLVLTGCEVKSIRTDKININDAYAVFVQGELFLRGSRVNPYDKGSYYNSDITRDRKLLLNKSEINKLIGKVQEKGFTLVPLSAYFRGSLVKVELGICKGKHTYDKRESLKQRDIARDTERRIKEFR
jgi:SsrA-binding protein